MTNRADYSGEFGLIEQIKTLCEILPSNGFEGIGDDCARLAIGGGESLLFTSDMLIERVHFLREATSPYELGGKSLAVNLSDVAAMGATPIASLLSLSIPSELRGEWIEEFMRGYRDMSAEFGVSLIGGDTTASKGDLSINITAIGRCEDGFIRRRCDARAEDVIATTGLLGASGAGLADILRGEYSTLNASIHRNPKPQVHEGYFLAHECEGVRAMMDISDGIGSDLHHILNLSGVCAEIELSQIPIAEGATLHQALSSGEDYQLLFTVAAESFESVQRLFTARFNKPLYPIGRIVEGETSLFNPSPSNITWLNQGDIYEGDFRGFTHY